MEARVKYMDESRCMGVTASNGLEMMDCSGDATVAKIWSIGDSPVTYRFEYGERVIDVPNESTAAGVTLSTYSWNAGAHQRYVLESAPVNNEKAFYLQNYKSKLYLLPSGKNVVQDQRSRDVTSGVWILEEVAGSGTPDDTASTDIVPADTSAKDSAEIDTGVADTTVADTAATDTVVADTTQDVPETPSDTSTISVRRNYREPAFEQVLRNKFDLKGRRQENALKTSRWNVIFMK